VSATRATHTFAGSMPEYYDQYLGPGYFHPLAAMLASRVPARPPGDVLEIACGTGAATRALRERLDPSVRLVATDFSLPMLEYARAKIGERGIEWRQADGTSLPFRDAEFGLVFCSLGFMFMPDRRAAFAQARRVLARGGQLVFDVWDRIELTPASHISSRVIESLRPGDKQLHFRVPWEMSDVDLTRSLLAEAGFGDVRVERKALQIVADPRRIATGQLRGTPRMNLLVERGIDIDEAIAKVAAALEAEGGNPYRGQAAVIVVEARAA
jgi:SAM-dependent methyltransferase